MLCDTTLSTTPSRNNSALWKGTSTWQSLLSSMIPDRSCRDHPGGGGCTLHRLDITIPNSASQLINHPKRTTQSISTRAEGLMLNHQPLLARQQKPQNGPAPRLRRTISMDTNDEFTYLHQGMLISRRICRVQHQCFGSLVGETCFARRQNFEKEKAVATNRGYVHIQIPSTIPSRFPWTKNKDSKGICYIIKGLTITATLIYTKILLSRFDIIKRRMTPPRPQASYTNKTSDRCSWDRSGM